MKVFVAGLLVIWAVLDVTSARIIVRRSVPSTELERESDSPASEVIVIKDTDSRYPTGPRYGLIPNDNESNVFEIDVNDDGTFNFGGHLPHDHHHIHRSFAEIFAAMQRRMEEMTRSLMSGFDHSFGPSAFRPSTDVESIPDNTNKTETEIVTFNGRRYLKKTKTIKKGGEGSTIFIRSVSYEPVDDTENTETGSETEGSSSSEKPNPDAPLPGEAIQPQETQEGTRVTDSTPSPSSSSTPVISSQSPSVDQREREEMTSPATPSL